MEEDWDAEMGIDTSDQTLASPLISLVGELLK
jgi:hypothetical protein